jgi:haloacetate dehalogenase
VWRTWCENVEGAVVKSGHFLAEENPTATLAALVPFLTTVANKS